MRERIMAGRRAVAGTALLLAALLTLTVSASQNSAEAAAPLAGSKVSSADLRTLVAAAESCPTLTPARLAGQVMAASQFSSTPVDAMRAVGAKGPAALTPQVWNKWAPWPGAKPGDREASIIALAHGMCQLIGQIRVVKIDGDQWQLALAAHRTSMAAVVSAGDIPSGAEEYVETVERYASWYALQPEFGGSGQAAPAATPDPQVNDAPVVAVPDDLVAEVVAAGKVCPEISPATIAAQVMATSGFDEQKLGPTGEQGIAQFLPQTWVKYVPPSESSSPWDAKTALPALGKTMCALVKSAGEAKDAYADALAAFTQGADVDSAGDSAAVTRLVAVIDRNTAEYAKDTRLQLPASATPPTSASAGPSATAGPPPTGATKPAPPKTTTRKPAKTSTKTATPKRDQPPVKAANADGRGRSYGPYFLLDYGTKMCMDVPGYGVGPRDGPVNQAPCAKTGADNQEYAFVPRAKDGSGNQQYWIRSVTDNYCIDPPGVGSVAPETPLAETGCFDQDNQYFRLVPTLKSGGFQYYRVINTASGMCIDVPGAKNAGVDARLQLVGCLANDDHDWALVQKSEW